MRLLLDTHAWLWFALGEPQLSGPARVAILDPANEKFLSPASYWEISIKIAIGKYALAGPYDTFMCESIEGNGIRRLDITPAHTAVVATLPFPHGDRHRDPFDRLLIAQALSERMTVVTDDRKFDGYGVPILW